MLPTRNHFRDRNIREGALLGLVWFVVNLASDQLMFSTGLMAMRFGEYLSDIGVTYLMAPIIPVGMGMLRARR